MRIARKRGEPTYRGRPVLVGLIVIALIGMVALVGTSLVMRDGNSSPSAATTPPVTPDSISTPRSTIESAEVVARLQEILQVRDHAIQTRDPSLLTDVYTTDCPCLKGDQQLIQKLRKEQLMWRGVEVSIAVQKTQRVNDHLWTISALVTTSPFDIVTESGAIVRKVPQGQELSRFALAKPIDQDNWSLGYAMVVQERD